MTSEKLMNQIFSMTAYWIVLFLQGHLIVLIDRIDNVSKMTYKNADIAWAEFDATDLKYS